jgi:hypothetical protein
MDMAMLGLTLAGDQVDSVLDLEAAVALPVIAQGQELLQVRNICCFFPHVIFSIIQNVQVFIIYICLQTIVTGFKGKAIWEHYWT